jgi:hypothetical protein
LIIAGFVIAFKVLEMIFETALVSALSGLFYVAMAVTLNYPLTMNRVLLFAFLGSTLYMAFSLFTTLAQIALKLISIPKSLIQSVIGLVSKFKTPKHQKNHKKLSKKVKNYTDKVEELSKKLEQKSDVPKNNESSDDEENDNEVKEVVLNKVKEDKQEESEQDSDTDNSEEYRI